ncbi:uncharacterized protein LOC122630598 [Vespula pensylvanica]|uniref:uncharacterized protein LOC122630598 n=1 Tax=Vespula pensylvanica TaxID=30213 RepID=UPI001CBA512B|nr:uncharacterized protein LOC122630598 [Vespula pensylvanica]
MENGHRGTIISRRVADIEESSSPREQTSRDHHHRKNGHRGNIITRRVTDIEGHNIWKSEHRRTIIIRRADIKEPSSNYSRSRYQMSIFHIMKKSPSPSIEDHRGSRYNIEGPPLLLRSRYREIIITRYMDIEDLSSLEEWTLKDCHHSKNGH